MNGKLAQLFEGYQKRVVKIGDTLHVTIGGDKEMAALDRKIKSALSRGETVEENRVARWIDFREYYSEGKYVWHKDGNRVKCRKVLCTKNFENQSYDELLLGDVWKDFLSL